ncbi:MAG: NTP transferase domain-containing protein [Actinomycetes bacterium]
MRTAGVVLAGGRSSRMGTAKAALDWHGSTLLRHVVGVVARAQQGRVVVVRAAGQPLPQLPAGVEVYDDPRDGLGPLQGMAVGLAALADDADVAFVCSTDLPFLHTAFVRRVLRAFAEAEAEAEPEADPGVDVVLPLAHGYPQPLAAGYRTALAPTMDLLLEAGRLKPAMLFEQCSVLRLDETALLADRDLAALDPELDSVVNVNDAGDYAAACARPAPEVTVRCFGVVPAGATAGPRGPRTVRAATVRAAAEAIGLAWDRRVLGAVNGDQTGRDGHQPLVSGDDVAFLSAVAGG